MIACRARVALMGAGATGGFLEGRPLGVRHKEVAVRRRAGLQEVEP